VRSKIVPPARDREFLLAVRNALPLVPYFIYQRILKRPVPDGVRGSHGGLLERVKQRLIDVETRIDPPAGVTLIGEVRPR